MSNFYVSSVGYTAVVQWAALTATTVGTYRRQLAAPTVNNERVFKATAITTGITGAAEPSWNLGFGATTTDAGVTWTEITGTQANQSAANWTAPGARILALPGIGAGDYIYVGQDHAETTSAGLQLNMFNDQKIICVNRAGGSSLPPVTADLATTATITCTQSGGNFYFNSSVTDYWYGITFNAGSGSNSTSLSNNNGTHIFDNCNLVLSNTNSASRIENTNSNASRNSWVLKNSTVQFGSTSQGISNTLGTFEWYGSPSPGTLGSVPTTLFVVTGGAAGQRGNITVRDVDLSAINTTLLSSNNISNTVTLANCKLNSSVSLTGSGTGTATSGDASVISIDNCDDSTNARNYRMQRVYGASQVIQDAVLVRTGGASDGVTPISHRITLCGTTALDIYPGRGVAVTTRYNTTGASKTITIETIYNGATALTNAQCWIEVEALTTAGAPLGSLTNSHVANYLGSTAAATLTASTKAWDSQVTARQNSHAYVTGDRIKVATNPGRVFFCTSGGTSAGSEPGGYATAVDGGAVTDNGATFRAGWRESMVVTVTPQMAGMLSAVVKFVTSTGGDVLWYDPYLTIA